MGVKKQIFTMELTDAVIQEIIQNGGGEIHISTSEYQDLNSHNNRRRGLSFSW